MLSQRYETFLGNEQHPDAFDVIIIGSGYGGAVAAARLAAATKADGSHLSVLVLERGDEIGPGQFPDSIGSLPGHVRIETGGRQQPIGRSGALFRIYANGDTAALVGNAVGGGSQINAGIAEQPLAEVFAQAAWPLPFRREAEMGRSPLKKYYALAEGELGVQHQGSPIGNACDKGKALRDLRGYIALACARMGREAPNVDVAKMALDPGRCAGIGNCVTGCNMGAKNTLSKNYLEKATNAEARILSGAHVSRVRHAPEDAHHPWRVECLPTEAEKRPERRRESERRSLRARIVILAAGTFGSTEILLRSRDAGLRLSDTLGTRYSGNGDSLHFRYAEDNAVNALASVGNATPGPTITHIIDARRTTLANDRPPPFEEQVVFEDGAVPSAITQIFGELIATGAAIGQMNGFRTIEERLRLGDPLAVTPELLSRSQVLLAMGHDGAAGVLARDARGHELELDEFRPVRVIWPGAAAARTYAVQEELLDLPDRAGVSIVNPFSRPIPRFMSEALKMPAAGVPFSVHPLGGCPMGDDAVQGTVNHKGQVFDTTAGPGGTAVYHGLYVMDGSIMPGSLGINPFLTITALAERAMELLIADFGFSADAPATARQQEGQAIEETEKQQTKPEPKVLPQPEVALRLRERLRMEKPLPAVWLDLFAVNPPPDPAKSAIFLELEYDVPDTYAFLQNEKGLERRIPFNTGACRLVLAEDQSRLALDRDWREVAALPVTGGNISFLEIEPACCLTCTWRGLKQWWLLRGRIEIFREIRNWLGGEGKTSLKELPGRFWQLLHLAYHAGERRHIGYALKLDDSSGKPFAIAGTKHIRFDHRINPWRALLDIDLELTGMPTEGSPVRDARRFSVDVIDLLRNRPPQILKQANAPTGLLAMLGLGLFFARLMLRMNIWHFRAPDYPPDEACLPPRRTAGPLAGCIGPDFHDVPVPRTPGAAHADLNLLLTRFQPDPGVTQKYPVVLFPGFAASSLQFSTDHIGDSAYNLPQVLCAHGFDVWLADVRTSSALPSVGEQWDFDSVSAIDVPWLIDFVKEKCGKDRVLALGHCMGGAILSQAASAGRLDGRIAGYVFSQVTPFVVASEDNALRAELFSLFRDTLWNEVLHPTVDRPPTTAEAVFDRIAWSAPVPEESAYPLECDPRPELATVKRLTALLGVMWLRDNVTAEMEKGFHETYGPGNVATFWQIMHYAHKGRVVGAQGENRYAVDEGLARAFADVPALFVHGERSGMFDPRGSKGIAQHLVNLFGPTAWKRFFYLGLPDYGHFDPIIGRRAAEEVHVPMARFLQQCRPFAPLARASTKHRLLPVRTGPVIGWTRANDGAPLARLWVELDAELTTEPQGAVFFRCSNGMPVAAWFAPARRVSHMGCYAVADVPLAPGGASEYRCLGLHAAPFGHVDGPTPWLPESKVEENPDDLPPTPDDPDNVRTIFDIDLTDLQPDELDGKALEKLIGVLKTGMENESIPQDDLARCTATIRSPVEDDQSLCFILGSCRAPGSAFERDLSDGAFSRMNRLLDKREKPIAFALFVGDQIYADDRAEVFDTATPSERVFEYYRSALGSPHAAGLLRRLPTYMAPDDHEIYDNYNGLRGAPHATAQRVVWGRRAYRAYQLAHGPASPWLRPGSRSARHHYSFESGGFPFLVLDTRFERERATDRLMHDAQWQALDAFLGVHTQDNRPKFIVSGSVPLPMLRRTVDDGRGAHVRDDSWWGYPDAVRKLLELIVRHQADNVVFLSGDAHCSLFCKLTIPSNAGDLTAWSIVSSGLYSPYPFANTAPADYVLASNALHPADWVQGPLQGTSWQTLNQTERNAFAVVSANNTAGGWTIDARFHLDDGNIV